MMPIDSRTLPCTPRSNSSSASSSRNRVTLSSSSAHTSRSSRTSSGTPFAVASPLAPASAAGSCVAGSEAAALGPGGMGVFSAGSSCGPRMRRRIAEAIRAASLSFSGFFSFFSLPFPVYGSLESWREEILVWSGLGRVQRSRWWMANVPGVEEVADVERLGGVGGEFIWVPRGGKALGSAGRRGRGEGEGLMRCSLFTWRGWAPGIRDSEASRQVCISGPGKIWQWKGME